MPAKDIYHNAVRTALEKDGWIITDDPFKLKWGLRELFVDLGAKKLLAAEKGEQKIIVEVKSFISPSAIADLQNALGQYLLYTDILEESTNEYLLYLAIRESTYKEIFSEPIGTLVLKKHKIHLLIFDPNQEEITQWID